VGLRVLVVDDNPHVRWRGAVYPVNATFHRFLSAFLDLPGAPVTSIAHAVPLRELPDDAPSPVTLPLDPRIRTVATAPFDGIAGFLRHAGSVTRANRPILRAAMADADLVWIKVPASNAALAAALAVRLGRPRFTWVAGRAAEVAAGRYGGRRRLAGMAVGIAYDGIGRTAALGGLRVEVGKDVVGGRGVVASLLEPSEIRDASRPRVSDPARPFLAWAGRLAPGKGIETLLDAVALLPATMLDMLGDGPARLVLEGHARALGIAGRVRWLGYVAERASYLDALAEADLFVFPSPSEGFPKAVLDAMAVGLPVVASTAGALKELRDARLIAAAPATDPVLLAARVQAIANDQTEQARLRRAGHEFARSHTRWTEAARVVELWRERWPALPW
jgi:glycosyltransferase involved in cell wall biosynthesis